MSSLYVYVRVMCVCIRYLLCVGIICGVMVIVVIVVVVVIIDVS